MKQKNVKKVKKYGLQNMVLQVLMEQQTNLIDFMIQTQ